ncbi:MAG: hypothetical protein V1717_03695 [Candidatus Micrarchaeota archaeon]
MRAFIFTLDAFFALSLAMLLAVSIAVFSQSHEDQLIQLHQLGRDYLVLTHKQGVSADFTPLTGFNSSGVLNVSSSVIAYPECGTPDCLKQQDSVGETLVFNATVSP